MELVNVLEINYKNYGKCLKVTNNIVEIIVTIEYGPRIIKYGYVNGKNHFAEGVKNKISTLHGDYYIIGGHRFWHIPENKDRTYIPDNKPVEYESMFNGVRLIQKIEKWTQVQKIIEITFEENSPKVKILHKIISLNAFDINIAIAGITSMDKGGIQIVPIEKRKEGTVPNRSIVFWPYSNIKDPRVYFGEKYVAMKVCENTVENFKMGFNTNISYALYYNENELFIKEFEKIQDKNLNYPDMGCSYESFIGNDYIEMQTNSPIYVLETNKCIEHVEIWNLYKDVNLDFIETFIDSYKA
mgnify:FL=1